MPDVLTMRVEPPACQAVASAAPMKLARIGQMGNTTRSPVVTDFVDTKGLPAIAGRFTPRPVARGVLG